MRIGRSGDADMTEGVIWKQVISFSIPMMIGLLFQQLYNTVDAVIVGHFVGDAALAAVGSTGSVLNMLVGLCMGLSTGAGIVISQLYGAHDHEKLSRAVHTAITLTLILSVFATVVGVLITPSMLRLMKTPDDVIAESTTYLTIYFAGITGLLIYNMGSGILRAVGDSRRPLYFLICSAVLNTIGDLIFVVTFDWGVAGVAAATILSQMVSAVLVLWVLSRTDAPYGLKFRQLGIDRERLHSIFAMGLPSSIQQVLTSFSNVFVQSYINVFGKECMAGWTSYNKIDAFILIPVQSISMAAATFVGQNYGAKKYKRARDGVRITTMMSFTVCFVATAVVLLLQKYLLMLFSLEGESMEFGRQFITIISPFYLTICFNQIYASALRGTGSAKLPTVIMLCSFVGFRQLFLYVNSLLGGSFVATALAYPAGWVVCTILLTIAYRRCKLFTLEETVLTADVSG